MWIAQGRSWERRGVSGVWEVRPGIDRPVFGWRPPLLVDAETTERARAGLERDDLTYRRLTAALALSPMDFHTAASMGEATQICDWLEENGDWSDSVRTTLEAHQFEFDFDRPHGLRFERRLGSGKLVFLMDDFNTAKVLRLRYEGAQSFCQTLMTARIEDTPRHAFWPMTHPLQAFAKIAGLYGDSRASNGPRRFHRPSL